MTNHISESTISAIRKIENKGDPIPVAGATESGKSTAMGFLAESDAVRDLMSMREAEGKGSTIETNIVATDCEDIFPDVLYVKADLKLHHIATTSDDNDFLSKIIHPVIRKYDSEFDYEELFKNDIADNIRNVISDAGNDTLANMIKRFPEENISELINVIASFPIVVLKNIQIEARAICEERYQPKSRNKAERRIFRELISTKSELSSFVDTFWKCVVTNLDKQSETFREELKSHGAVFYEDNCFIIGLTNEDYDTEFGKELLDSENEAKEFLLSNMSLIFRGSEKLFSSDLIDLLTVTEQNGEEVHVIRFVDTMGLFHSEEVAVEDESDRVVTLLSNNHADKLVLIVNGHITDTVKDGNEAIKGFLRKLKRDISIFILSTHWDEAIIQESKGQNVSKRRNRSLPIDWNAAFTALSKKQDELINSFENCLEGGRGKGKPHIEGVYNAAILMDMNSDSENLLGDNGVEYENALHLMVEDILLQIKSKGKRIKVKEGIEHGCTVFPDNREWDVRGLYRNMVVDCKGHKYWASSVRAVRDKWMIYALNHDSDIAENKYGFMNIHSNFVIDMRNFAMHILNNTSFVQLSIDEYIVGDADKDSVKEELVNYLKDGQYFGKKFAKILGHDSFNKGFKRHEGFCYQYERLTDMLQYTQDTYFISEKIDISDIKFAPVLEMLQLALRESVSDFVNAKCIEVY